MTGATRPGIGNRLAPARFLLFAGLAGVAMPALGIAVGWRLGVMAGFDIAATAFLLSCIPLFAQEADAMRQAAERNDANRATLLVITGAVTVAILVAVASELTQHGSPDTWVVALVVATLVLSWLFSNLVYALHYAHIYYTRAAEGGDSGGIDVPGTKEPDYWDFVYFAFTLGMTFQTSDVEIGSAGIRRVAISHCFAAFVFNIGVLAFSINVLGGGG